MLNLDVIQHGKKWLNLKQNIKGKSQVKFYLMNMVGHQHNLFSSIFFFNPHPGICLLILGGRERRKRNINVRENMVWWFSLHDLTRNGTRNLSEYGTLLQPTEPHPNYILVAIYCYIREKKELCFKSGKHSWLY